MENLLETGDYLELVESSQNDTVLYEVIADPVRVNTEERLRVKYIKETGAGDGNFNLEEVSEIRVIKQKLGLDIVEADKRYVQRPYTVQFSNTAPTEGQAETKHFRMVNCGMTLRTYSYLSGITMRGLQQCLRCLKTLLLLRLCLIFKLLRLKPDITSSTTAPANPKQGDLWFNPSTLKVCFLHCWCLD